MKSKIVLFLSLAFLCIRINAQIAKTQVVMINAAVESDGIRLTWPQMPGSFTGQILVYKRDSLQQSNWGSILATLDATATSYKDLTVKKGKAVEYRVVPANGNTAVAFGYIYAGNELRETLLKTGIVLLIDSTYIASLSTEIIQLEKDLSSEGWKVSKLYVGRDSKTINVKQKLISHINSNKQNKITTLMIIGHVPVPYSGGFTGDGTNFPPPDGHVEGSGNHTGAWPADGYYGDPDGVWTDYLIDLTTGAQTRHHNVPNDGKFDQVKFHGGVNLEVGRVDFFGMTIFNATELQLTKNYFKRNHEWRTGKTKSTERALIDNNFTSLNLASTGYQNFAGFFPIDSIFDNKDYMTTMRSNSYLWSYGCGAGSYTDCSGIGSSTDFATDSIQTIFTMLAGSFFGDWDINNNFLRAPLCRSSLASFWGGIPKWYVHTMGLGKHIGFGAKESMNNITFYFDGGFNGSGNSVHMALMGDPTLKNRHLPPTHGLTATSNNEKVNLKWNKAIGNFDGYALYRKDTAKNLIFKVSNFLISDTFYTDSANYFSGNYQYFVATIKKETTASGSYFNLGGYSSTFLKHTNAISTINKKAIEIYPNPNNGFIYFNNNQLSNFRLIDRMGKELSFVLNKEKNQIDIQHLSDGIYFLTCVDENNIEISLQIVKLAH